MNNLHPHRETPRWLSVFGAMVAIQTQQHYQDGICIDDEIMKNIVLDAITVADWSEKVYDATIIEAL